MDCVWVYIFMTTLSRKWKINADPRIMVTRNEIYPPSKSTIGPEILRPMTFLDEIYKLEDCNIQYGLTNRKLWYSVSAFSAYTAQCSEREKLYG